MPAATEWGGQGLPTLVSTAVLEMWKSSNLAFSLCQMLTLGAVEAIAHHGSDALKRRFLEPMVAGRWTGTRSEEHTSELQSQSNLVCRLLLEKKKNERPTKSYQPSRAHVQQMILVGSPLA